MHKFNITIPEAQMRTLFKSYDKDNHGSISYYNFLHHVLPADFPDDGKGGADPAVSLGGDADSRTNNVALRNPYFAKAEKRSANYVRRAFRGHGDFQELERILRSKIQEKTKSGVEQRIPCIVFPHNEDFLIMDHNNEDSLYCGPTQ